jgi:hypothetical protein
MLVLEALLAKAVGVNDGESTLRLFLGLERSSSQYLFLQKHICSTHTTGVDPWRLVFQDTSVHNKSVFHKLSVFPDEIGFREEIEFPDRIDFPDMTDFHRKLVFCDKPSEFVPNSGKGYPCYAFVLPLVADANGYGE